MEASLNATSNDTSHHHLKKHCQTRWIEQADALGVFTELFDAVIEVLNTISHECDSNTASTAYQLSSSITNFTFLVSLSVASHLMNYTKPQSVFLQKSGLDLCEAMKEVTLLQELLARHRDQCNDYFNGLFRNAVQLAEIYGIAPSKPRVCGRQINRANFQCEDVEQYYRTSVFVPFLDHMLQGLRDRFGSTQQQIALACKLVPSVLMASQHMMESEVKVLVNAFPDIQSPNSFESEYDRWLSKWRSNKEETARITGFAEACFNADSDLFPGIHTVLKVSATRPSSTASNVVSQP